MVIKDCFVSVIAPLHNNAPIVSPFVQEAVSVLQEHYLNYELVLVDDYSTDNTVEEVKKILNDLPCIRLIRLTKYFGTEIAITAGLDSVIGDYVVIMEPFTDPPKEIPTMIQKARVENKIVAGVTNKQRKKSILVYTIEPILVFIMNRLMEFKLPPNTSYFWVLTRHDINAITRIRQKNRHFRVLVSNVCGDVSLHSYAQALRSDRQNKIKLFDILSSFFSMIVSQSMMPLRIISLTGLICSLLIFLSLITFFIINIVNKNKFNEWIAIIFLINILFSINLFIIAVLSEYIGRILEESKEKPLYYVMSELNSSVLTMNNNRLNVFEKSVEVPHEK